MIEKIFEQVKDKWNQTTEQGIKDFVEIPALSPDFDKKWEENGVLLKAVEFAKNWVEKQDIKGLSTKIVQEEGFPPCLYVEIEASEGNTAKESGLNSDAIVPQSDLRYICVRSPKFFLQRDLMP